MSAKHKKLLRLAAEKMDTINDAGMCYAVALAYGQSAVSRRDYRVYRECGEFVRRMYRDDSPSFDRPYWMGFFIPENKQHRVMALLFAAEAYDDMEGL